jgi:hypothetical protein
MDWKWRAHLMPAFRMSTVRRLYASKRSSSSEVARSTACHTLSLIGSPCAVRSRPLPLFAPLVASERICTAGVDHTIEKMLWHVRHA